MVKYDVRFAAGFSLQRLLYIVYNIGMTTKGIALKGIGVE